MCLRANTEPGPPVAFCKPPMEIPAQGWEHNEDGRLREAIANHPLFVYNLTMTPELLERDWLSLRYWLTRCVLPSMMFLLGALILLRMIDADMSNLNHNAVIVGFFVFYFVLVRGGHIIMVRSLHFELKRKYEDHYREKLAYVPIGQIKRRNIGFTLARIKRELIDMKVPPKSQP